MFFFFFFAAVPPPEDPELHHLKLVYFSDEQPPDPEVYTPVVAVGAGCHPQHDRCGVFVRGKARDETMKCGKPVPVALPTMKAFVDAQREAIRKQGKLAQESLVTVATLDADGDGKEDRIVEARFTIKKTPENAHPVGDQAPRCSAVLLDLNHTVVPISVGACEKFGVLEVVNQVFTVEGEGGFFVHLRQAFGDYGGGYVAQVKDGKATRVAFPKCEGNG